MIQWPILEINESLSVKKVTNILLIQVVQLTQAALENQHHLLHPWYLSVLWLPLIQPHPKQESVYLLIEIETFWKQYFHIYIFIYMPFRQQNMYMCKFLQNKKFIDFKKEEWGIHRKYNFQKCLTYLWASISHSPSGTLCSL